VKRGFPASFPVVLCRELSGKVAVSLVKRVVAWLDSGRWCLERSIAALFEVQIVFSRGFAKEVLSKIACCLQLVLLLFYPKA
jgi:hypothetical protein